MSLRSSAVPAAACTVLATTGLTRNAAANQEGPTLSPAHTDGPQALPRPDTLWTTAGPAATKPRTARVPPAPVAPGANPSSPVTARSPQRTSSGARTAPTDGSSAAS